MDLSSVSVETMKGIGAKTAQLLKRLHICSVLDLLWYVPRAYTTYPDITKIADLTDGGTYAVYARLSTYPKESHGRMVVTTFSVSDGSGSLNIVFFRQSFIKNIFRAGQSCVFYGTVKKKGSFTSMEMPEYYSFEEYKARKKSLQGIYPLTKGISSKAIQKYLQQAINDFFPVTDPFDEDFIHKHELLSMSRAFSKIHFPENEEEYRNARRTLVYHEFYDYFKQIGKQKDFHLRLPTDHKITSFDLSERYIARIPYPLTGAQQKVFQEIRTDLSSGYVMHRLLQGDVGSGKTLLSFLAIAAVCAFGFQSAMMVPTEVLAKQHYESLIKDSREYDLHLHPVLLTGSLTAALRKKVYQGIEDGEYNVIIGTHAVFQEKVSFRDLALVITDEQHRFGVKQREALAGKGDAPHVLVMSATPIPRTLTQTLYADLSLSVMDEMPASRLPIKSCVIDAAMRKTAFDFITKEIAAGHQAYIICPMVEDNEDLDLESVTSYPGKYGGFFPPSVRIGVLHGQMKNADKNKIMEAFAEKAIDLLISTTVVEVGINVPNATVIMIENAERFGLAGLHQLRGRVGRGAAQSYCIFLNGSGKKEQNERLEVLHRSNDGFYIAEEDLRLRGPGDINGIRQSGELMFKVADIIADHQILTEVKDLF